MNKLKKLNRLNKSKTLNVALAVGLVASNLVTAAPAVIAAPSSHVYSVKSTISQTTATFDKKTPEDITVTYAAVNGYELKAIKYGSKTLVQGTDYTIDGTSVTISKDYLAKLPNGTKTLKFDFDKGTDPTLRITVKDTSAKINMTKTTFDARHPRDIKVRLTTNGNQFVGVSNEGADLEANTDYTQSGSYVTISKDYLAQLQNGVANLSFNFDAGTTPVLAVTIKNSGIVETTLKSVSAENGKITANLTAAEAAVASDFVVTQSIDGAAATTLEPTLDMSGAVATLTVNKVPATAAEQTVVYSVSYKGGTAKTATVKVAAQEVVTVASVSDITTTAVTVDNGTTKDDVLAKLDQKVTLTLSDTTTKDAAIAWTCDSYDGTKAGDYDFTGKITLPDGVTDPTGVVKDVTAKVTVAQPALVASNVSVVNATTVDVVLAQAPATELTNSDASKFTVKANGNDVAVSAVAKKAGDLTGKSYRLTIASLAGTQGDLTVNATAAAVPTGKVYAFDYQAPQVLSIVPQGNRTLQVTFSEKMDSATVIPANLEVTKDGAVLGAGLPHSSITQVQMDATQTVATVVLAADLTVADYKIVLGETDQNPVVKDVAGNATYGGTEISFRPTADQLLNSLAPSIVTATYNKVTGNLTLTFNKNILDSTLDVSKLSLNGVALTGSTVTTGAANDNLTVITLSSANKAAVNAATGSLSLTSAKDAYGDATKLTSGETVSVASEEPALVSTASYNQQTNLLTVKFDKPVTLEATTTLSIDDADELGSAAITKAMAVNSDGSAADTSVASDTWTFNATPVAATIEGLSTANLKVYILANAVKNQASVLNAATQSTYATGVAVSYIADQTKPVLQSAEWNNNIDELTLTFSEKIDLDTAAAAVANIDLLQAKGTPLVGFTDLTGLVPTEAAGSKTTTLTFDLSGNAADEAALELAFNTGKSLKVTLGASVAQDEALLDNDATTYDTGIAVVYKDYDPPTLGTTTPTNKNLVVLQFNEPLNRESAENVSTYAITDTTGAQLAINKAVLQAVAADGTQEVYLTTADQTSNAPYTVKVTNIRDASNNILASATDTFNGSTLADATALTVSTLAVAAPVNSSNDTLTVSYNVAPDTTLATNLNNYVVLQADTNDATGWDNATQISLTNAKAEMVPGTPTDVTITLTNSSNLQTGKYYKVIVSNVTTVTGKALGTASGDNDAISALTAFAAPAAPAIYEYNTASNNIKLVFNEELVAVEASKASNYFVANNGGHGPYTVQSATYSWDSTTGKATVVLNLDKALGDVEDVTLDAAVTNLAGEPLALLTVAAPLSLGDGVAPSVDTIVANTVQNSAANAGSDVITITFKDLDLLGASASLSSNYVVKDANGNTIDPTKYTVAFVDGTPDKVTITFDQTASANVYNMQYGQNYSVAVSGVVDTSGNVIASTTKTATWDAASDKTGPTLNAAITSVTDATKTFTVTYAEDADVTTASDKANYTVAYSADGAYDDTVMFTPIFVSYNTATKVATIVVSDTVDSTTVGSKFKVTIKNVKDLAGNVSDGTLSGHSAEITN